MAASETAAGSLHRRRPEPEKEARSDAAFDRRNATSLGWRSVRERRAGSGGSARSVEAARADPPPPGARRRGVARGQLG